jgi:hypothetical protein
MQTSGLGAGVVHGLEREATETSDIVGEGGSVQQRRPGGVVVKTWPLG